MVIAVSDIEQADPRLDAPTQESPTSVQVELPEVLPRQAGLVTVVVLHGPNGIGAGEEADWILEERIDAHLMQRCLEVTRRGESAEVTNPAGDAWEATFQRCSAHTV